MASKPRNSCSGQPWIERRLRRLGVAPPLAPTLVLAVPGLIDYRPLTERWVTAQLGASLRPLADLDRIASILFGLVTPPRAAPIPALLERTAGLVRQLDPAGLDCGQRVNLRFIVALLLALQRTLSTRNPGDQNLPGPTPGAARP